MNPNSRAALSLLAYCYYTIQDFVQALQCYEQLIDIYPNERNYLLNYVKCLYQTGAYDKALKMAFQYTEKFPSLHSDEQQHSKTNSITIDNGSMDNKHDEYDQFARIELIKIQSSIKYTNDDENINAKLLMEQIPDDNVDKVNNIGCILFKEKRYEEAIEKFQNCIQMENLSLTNNAARSTGSLLTNDRKNVNDTDNGGGPMMANAVLINKKPDLLYNLAICYYYLRQYSEAMKYIGEIIEQGIREHPELSVGMNTEGLEFRSVGNTEVLHESVLVEAFNLKAAIEYQMKNYDSAKEALTDMPPRSEEELDAVTLHNVALISMDSNPAEGFEKLQFLINQETFQPETFANLLLLYCRYEYYELAADLMAENVSFTYKFLSPYLYEFLDALITQQTSPEDAYQKFDEIAAKHINSLRKLNKQILDVKNKMQTNADDVGSMQKFNETLKKLNNTFDETVELYVPVLMSQAKIYWDLECYSQVEKLFRKSAEFCNELELWKLNVAHVLFMQVKN